MNSSVTGLASLTLLAAALISVPAIAQSEARPGTVERDRISRRCVSTSAPAGALAPCPNEVIKDGANVAPRVVQAPAKNPPAVDGPNSNAADQNSKDSGVAGSAPARGTGGSASVGAATVRSGTGGAHAAGGGAVGANAGGTNTR